MSAYLMKDLLPAIQYLEGELLVEQLFSTTQKENESISDFASRLEIILFKLCTLAASNYDEGFSEILKLNFFRGLRDYRVKDSSWPNKDNLSFTKLIRIARRVEFSLK